MKSINRWIGEGRLTRDSELKYTQGGSAILKFSIAVNGTKKNGDSYEDVPYFFDCVLWGRLGEALGPKLIKGKQVFIEAELTQRRWEQDGQNRSAVELKVDEISLGADPRGARPSEAPSSPPPPRPQRPAAAPRPAGDSDDDIPF